MTLAEAVAHVCERDGCDATAAQVQLRKALGDGALFVRWEDERPTPRMPGGGAMIAPDRPGRNQAYWQSARMRGAEVFDPPDGVVTDAGRAAVAAGTLGAWRVLLLLRFDVKRLWPAPAAAPVLVDVTSKVAPGDVALPPSPAARRPGRPSRATEIDAAIRECDRGQSVKELIGAVHKIVGRGAGRSESTIRRRIQAARRQKYKSTAGF